MTARNWRFLPLNERYSDGCRKESHPTLKFALTFLESHVFATRITPIAVGRQFDRSSLYPRFRAIARTIKPVPVAIAAAICGEDDLTRAIA